MSTNSISEIFSKSHQRVKSSQNPHSAGPRAVGTKNTSLGIYAQSSSATAPEPQETPKDAATRRLWKRQTEAARLLPDEKIVECGRKVAPMVSALELVGNADGVHFRGFCQCDSPSCPRCSYRRAELERHKLSVLAAECKKRGYGLALMTETISHHWDSCADVIQALNAIHDKAFKGRWYNDLRKEWGILGLVPSWDTTMGGNGWHPHRHILPVFERPLSEGQRDHLLSLLRERWLWAAGECGFVASWEHGLDLRTADSEVADYIAKWGHEPLNRDWGVEDEMTKSHFKKARLDGMTPFELLDASYGDELALDRFELITGWHKRDELRAWAGRYYREWFKAFKRKPRIYWPKELRALLNLDEAWAACPDLRPEVVELPIAVIEAADVPKMTPNRERPDLRADLQILARRVMAGKAKRADLVGWFADHGIKARVLLPDDTPARPAPEQLALPGMVDRPYLRYVL